MKLLVALFLFIGFNLAEAASESVCIELEHSVSPDEVKHYSFAESHKRDRIALYQHIGSKHTRLSASKEKTTEFFRLWDSQTGKLLNSKKVETLTEYSSWGKLHFSPDDSIVYLADAAGGSFMKEGLPFWHLKDNRMVISACDVDTGVHIVTFSDDMELAYAAAGHASHSICSTHSKHALTNFIGYGAASSLPFTFDPQKKRAYRNYVFTDEETYKSATIRAGQYFQSYKSPVSRHSIDDPESSDTLATMTLGTPPDFRFLTAKSTGTELSIGLWHYHPDREIPQEIYQHTLDIPELTQTKRPIVDFPQIIRSPDGKKAVFLSLSSALVAFEIQSGKLLWKNSLLHQNKAINQDNIKYDLHLSTIFEDRSKLSDGRPLIFQQEKSQIIILVDWQAGQKTVVEIPLDFVAESYTQYDDYLLFEFAGEYDDVSRPNRYFLLNLKTAKQKIINIPIGFQNYFKSYPPSDTKQLVFESERDPSEANHKATTPYALFIYDLETDESRIVDIPSEIYSKYHLQKLHLSHGEHLLISSERKSFEPYMSYHEQYRNDIGLYNVKSQQYRALQKGSILSHWLGQNGNGKWLKTLSYDKQKQSLNYCQFNLEHKH